MIDLQVIINGLEMVDDMNTVFLDLETGDTVFLSDFDPSVTEDTAELLEAYPDRFLRLPAQREINEYGMMEDFIYGLSEGEQQRSLEMAINGRGAFRRFKDTVRRYGIEDRWYAFREAAYASLARRWCEENDVEYYQAGKAPSNPADMEKLLTDFFSDEDENEDKNLTPEQAAKLYDLFEQLQGIQGQLEDLAGEIEADEASEAISDAASRVGDAVDSLEETIESGINVNIVVDGKTSSAGIIKFTELLKKMADRDNEDE